MTRWRRRLERRRRCRQQRDRRLERRRQCELVAAPAAAALLAGGTSSGGTNSGGTSSGGTGSSGGKAGCPNQPAGATVLLDTPFNTSDGEGQLWELYPGAGKIVQPQGKPGAGKPAEGERVDPGCGAIYRRPADHLAEAREREAPERLVHVHDLEDELGLRRHPDSEQVGIPGRSGLHVRKARDERAARRQQANEQVSGQELPADLRSQQRKPRQLTCLRLRPGPGVFPERERHQSRCPTPGTLSRRTSSTSTCPTCKNGTVKWWIDGVLQGSYTNLNYGDGIVNEWQINHTWDSSLAVQCGPPTNPANPKGRDCTKDQIHYFDHVVLASVL